MLRHPVGAVRLAALESLSMLDAAAHTDAVLLLLNDDDRCVRGEALKAVVKIMQSTLLSRRNATAELWSGVR